MKEVTNKSKVGPERLIEGLPRLMSLHKELAKDLSRAFILKNIQTLMDSGLDESFLVRVGNLYLESVQVMFEKRTWWGQLFESPLGYRLFIPAGGLSYWTPWSSSPKRILRDSKIYFQKKLKRLLREIDGFGRLFLSSDQYESMSTMISDNSLLNMYFKREFGDKSQVSDVAFVINLYILSVKRMLDVLSLDISSREIHSLFWRLLNTKAEILDGYTIKSDQAIRGWFKEKNAFFFLYNPRILFNDFALENTKEKLAKEIVRLSECKRAFVDFCSKANL